jgi:anti-sigma-K factor RskA
MTTNHRYWYQHPSAVDQLAAAYVLGTLQGRARHRFEAAMRTRPELATAVASWTQRLGPMMTTLPPVEPSAATWKSIAHRVGIAPKAPPAKTSAWWQRWLAPLPAGALAMGLVVGTVAPMLWRAQMGDSEQQTQLPASYVGVLATAQGQPGLIVSSLRQGKVVEIKQVAPVEVPAGRTLYLWRIDKAGAVSAIGPVPAGKFVRMNLAEPAEKVFFTAVELAVSVEPLGSSPAAPTHAFVYRGLCGKLWR